MKLPKITLPTNPCFGRTGLFVPEDQGDQLGHDIAALLCRRCPYRVECAAQGLRHPDDHTIRAGVRMWEPYASFRLRDIIERETP